MKNFDIHKFTSTFKKVEKINTQRHKATLREITIAESIHKHTKYHKKELVLSFYLWFIKTMKNVKLVGATAIVILVSLLSSIFAPSVMAHVAVNNGLEYLSTVSASDFQNAGYSIDIVDFENSLVEAKNATDLRTISEKDAIKAITDESDMAVIIGSTGIDDPNYVAPPEVEMVGNGTIEDPYRPKDGVALEYQPDSRITKYLQYTNPEGKKVVLGIDKNNLPIIIKISQ